MSKYLTDEEAVKNKCPLKINHTKNTHIEQAYFGLCEGSKCMSWEYPPNMLFGEKHGSCTNPLVKGAVKNPV